MSDTFFYVLKSVVFILTLVCMCVTHVWIHSYVFACVHTGTRVWRLGVDGECLPLSLSPFLLTGALTNWLD